MSDIMLLGVLRMPYEMAMSDEMSRLQFYSRAQEAADRIVSDEAEIARLTAERDAAMAGLNKIADGYGPNHLSKYARDMAQSALAALQPDTERQPLDIQLRAINDIPEDPLK